MQFERAYACPVHEVTAEGPYASFLSDLNTHISNQVCSHLTQCSFPPCKLEDPCLLPNVQNFTSCSPEHTECPVTHLVCLTPDELAWGMWHCSC